MTKYEIDILKQAVRALEDLMKFLPASHREAAYILEKARDIISTELRPRFSVAVSYASKNGHMIKFTKTIQARDLEDALITAEVTARRRKSFAGKLDMQITRID
jgi:hypothetical protein